MVLSNHISVSVEKLERMCLPPPKGIDFSETTDMFMLKMDQIIQGEFLMDYYLRIIPCKMEI